MTTDSRMSFQIFLDNESILNGNLIEKKYFENVRKLKKKIDRNKCKNNKVQFLINFLFVCWKMEKNIPFYSPLFAES